MYSKRLRRLGCQAGALDVSHLAMCKPHVFASHRMMPVRRQLPSSREGGRLRRLSVPEGHDPGGLRPQRGLPVQIASMIPPWCSEG
jgi:hypothetical protein